MKRKPGVTLSQGQERRDVNDCLDLRLYVTDETPRCLAAYENLTRICEENAGGRYRITVLDIRKNPELARRDDITAIPTLIRLPPLPGRRRIIGILSDTKRVLAELGLPEQEPQNRKAGKIIRRSSATAR